MLIRINKLHITPSTLWQRRRLLIHHIKIKRHRRIRIHAANLPRARPAHTRLALTHILTLIPERHTRPDRAAHLQLPRRLQLQRAPETHSKTPILILQKHPLKRLLEQRRIERVRQNHVPARIIRAVLHLVQTRLIHIRRININYVSIRCGSIRQRFIMLNRFLHKLRIVFINIVMRANREFELLISNHARSLRTGSSNKRHDPSATIRIQSFQKSNRDR